MFTIIIVASIGASSATFQWPALYKSSHDCRVGMIGEVWPELLQRLDPKQGADVRLICKRK
jgi:hypothetical protein